MKARLETLAHASKPVTATKCTADTECICRAVLTCCGASRHHYQHSWKLWGKTKRTGWYCTACDAVGPKLIRPGLGSRIAKCVCGDRLPSAGGHPLYHDLPMFIHHPELDCDTYYCGCKGWD